MSSTSNSNYSKSSRPVGHIDLRKLGVPQSKIAEIASMIIGYRGNGIKRYTSSVVGSFVRLQSDLKDPDPNIKVPPNQCSIVYISARTLQDVQKVALMVNQDILAHKNRSVSSSRPTLSIQCPPEIVSNIIGRGGNNIKSIITLVGDGCFIIHNKNTGMFDITANTPNACVVASNMIKQTIANLASPTPTPTTSTTPPPPPLKKNTGSRYSLLAEDESDSETESVTSSVASSVASTVPSTVASTVPSTVPSNVPSSSKKKTRRTAPNIARQLFHTISQSETESYRKEIRMMLSRKLDKDGNALYPDYTIWDEKQRTYVEINGPAAVPWEAVDQFISSRSNSPSDSNPISNSVPRFDAFPPINQNENTNEHNLTLSRSDAWSHTNPPNTNLWGSGNFQSVISSEGVQELNQRSIVKVKKSAEPIDPWDQPCNYYDLLDDYEASFLDCTPTTPYIWDEENCDDYLQDYQIHSLPTWG